MNRRQFSDFLCLTLALLEYATQSYLAIGLHPRKKHHERQRDREGVAYVCVGNVCSEPVEHPDELDGAVTHALAAITY